MKLPLSSLRDDKLTEGELRFLRAVFTMQKDNSEFAEIA